MDVSSTSLDLTPLESVLPEGCLITDPARTDKYRWDRALDPNAGVPMAVVRATCTADVQAAVSFAAARGIAVVPRGAGTGLSGGASAVTDCIVICTERMRSIEIDPLTRTAVVEPGLLNAEVKRAVAAHGLWYPPDPSSYEICSIGGNVATNAGGLCCVKYGVTTDYVLGMTVVLADGSAVKLGGKRIKDVAGLPLLKLFVGSEGTLGIVTEVILRLLPAPRTPTTLVATFASLDDATRAVLEVTQSMRPSMLEFMDNVSINAVEDVTKMGLDRSAEALLVAQSDEADSTAAAEIIRIESLCEANNAAEVLVAPDAETGEAFVAARRMAIPAVERRGTLLLEDVGVPVPHLGGLVRGIADISRANDVEIAVIAHAGDGNTHPLIVFDPMDADQGRRAQAAYGEIMTLAIGLGGTITGEHGVGRLKRPWLGANIGDDALALNRRIKQALDPAGILNPGSGL
ncbi:putative oxidoreductase (plasmid) [Mycolicibacterium arabiense]|uniref:Putative oxidoreductase n=1 Tax=Mycolicibacterium arabiense TaxID=1286181 RepID=A0A7I7RRP1_9MYCO|nr:FAD-linked oxidase C-terminal domain-containing protein [Mycolicibacterium arabiense]MCV7372018.1 FAD-binding protein [Mycolicibacterium arabiense]BBY46659.1 putative oxidoreductase [Mycolicibacterium arabiense]